ncbi:c-type cytochrome [Mesorhizobium escarrei]|nr:c-type cytochrome [Mesorhizobium escarrei]
MADGDAARGQKLFTRCSGCHTTTGENKAGPSLAGVFGRAAGKVDGARYSRAMASSNIVWDDVSIDAYLAGPTKFLPGTTMAIGVPNASDRADIIAYLRSLGPG